MKIKYFLSTILALSFISTFGQNKYRVYQKDTTINYLRECFLGPDEFAEFPSGNAGFTKYLKDNLKYPKSARKDKIEGTVNVKFVIDKEGNCPYIQILKGVREDIDDEVIRLLKNMPVWIPAKRKDGSNACNWFVIPVKFYL